MDTVEELRRKFYEKLNTVIPHKAINSGYLSKERYDSLVKDLWQIKEKIRQKTPNDYQKLKRYDVVRVGATDRLVHPVTSNTHRRYYVTTDELFDILHETHIAIGHGGRDRMKKEINKMYMNVTLETIKIYINLCEPCQTKLKVKGTVELTVETNSGCQVNLIDMQSREDVGFKFILVYQDHLTKFVQLRPLKSKTADEVTDKVLDIFTIFGVPSVLQIEDRECANKILGSVSEMWENARIVHGKLSEVDIRDVEGMLDVWLETNRTRNWNTCLRYVQYMKNQTYHEGIRCSPYEAMFGQPVKADLKSSVPPSPGAVFIKEEELE